MGTYLEYEGRRSQLNNEYHLVTSDLLACLESHTRHCESQYKLEIQRLQALWLTHINAEKKIYLAQIKYEQRVQQDARNQLNSLLYPPFYKSWWFYYSLGVLSGGGVLYLASTL